MAGSRNSSAPTQRTSANTKPKNPSGLAQSTPIDAPSPTPEPKDPLNFETLSVDSLRKYKDLHKVPVKSPYSDAGFYLDSKVGKKTYSYKHHNRTTKWEIAAACKRHFVSHHTRESDVIVDFIYSVKNQGEYKLVMVGETY